MKNVVELKLIENWLGHPSGTIVKVGDIQAKLMIGRGVAIINEGGDISGTKESEKESTNSEIQANKQEEKVVKMQKRNMDKMVKDSVNKHV